MLTRLRVVPHFSSGIVERAKRIFMRARVSLALLYIYATPKVTKYQRCNFIIQIHQITIKIDKININLLFECVKIVEFNFNSHVFHVMYQETRFLNQDACFFKSRRETTIFDPFCFRGGLKPSTRVGIQGLKVLTGLHDSCSSQIDWSLDLI